MALPARPARVALLRYGDDAARQTATLERDRLSAVAEAMRRVGITPELVIYDDAGADAVRAQLRGVAGVLVWVNPIERGHDRTVLDALLREIAAIGILVSAHPDIIQKMGTKEVLVRTRAMSWGSDTHLYETPEQLRSQLPLRLQAGQPRVLKQYRGNGGDGVWKVELQPHDPALLRVRHALRGSGEQGMPSEAFLGQCETYFTGAGRIIDQAYQERLPDGMTRCYLVQDKVVGFGFQAVNALFPPPPGAAHGAAPQPGPRLYYPPTAPEFQAIRAKMETEWLNDLCQILDIDSASLPLIWDADLLYGPKTASGEDTYVLCEINVSSVYPFPEAALEPLALATKERLPELSSSDD